MGGSGGGGSHYTARDIEVLREEARRRLEQSRIDSQVNTFLQQQLAQINDRDSDQISERLERIEEALRERIEGLDRLLFGGSVAKHTYVDGLSDVDSLVILNDPSLRDRSPEEVRNAFRDTLRQLLPQGDIQDIRVGNMAVTIRYRDGLEIQLLPAVQRGDQVAISSADGRSWNATRPREFAQRLTDTNKSQSGQVVPVIKLAKAILAAKLGQSAPSGYHIESMALGAFQGYVGPRNQKAMLEHFFNHATTHVLQPTADVTRQSVHVDENLGSANSPARRELSRSLGDIGRTISRSTSMSDWQSLFE